MKKNWDNIFDEPKGKKVWIFSIIGAIVLIVALVYIQLHHNFNTPIAKTIYDSVLAVATGILGAAVLNIVYREFESKKLNDIKSLSYNGMLQDFFSSLDELDGKTRKDERIRLEFHEFENSSGEIVPSLLEIRTHYSFYTKLNERSFECMFERILKKEEVIKDVPQYTSGISKWLSPYEFYWASDETDDVPEGVIDNDCFKIYDVFIDDTRVECTPNIKSEDGKVFIKYRFSLPGNCDFDKNKEYKIRLTVQLPMEVESILSLGHEYPTDKTEVEIDYRSLKDKISVYTMAVTGSIEVKQQSILEDGRCYYSHDGWILPKAGYIVAWWLKNNQDES